jgi:hypothetical protein
MRTRLLFEGAGAAIILLSARLFFVLSPYQLDLYHSFLPVNTLAGGVLIDLLVSTVLFGTIYLLLDKKDKNLRSLIWLGLLLILLRCGLNGLPIPEDHSQVTAQIFLIVKSHLDLISICLAAAGFALWSWKPNNYSLFVRGFRTSLLLLGCSSLWIVPELTYQALHQQKADVAKYVHSISSKQAGVHRRRIIWLLFDELSFDKLFEHRPKDLIAMNFDRLKQQSYFFTQVQPLGTRTEYILPGLFLGRRVDRIRSNLNGDLFLNALDPRAWQSFDEKSTFFEDAHKQGWTTGLVGYFNPYCRILTTVLDSCFWVSEVNPGGHLSSQLSSWRNASRPIENLFFHSGVQNDAGTFELHVRAYQKEREEGNQLLRNENIRFAFIHVGVPHPPGIYDRQTRRLGHGSYIDNLQLADTMLKEFLDTVEQSPSADRTTVIVSSDHSWRTWMWQGDPIFWNDEDNREAQAGFDPRPVLMIHLPGQQNRRDVNQSFQELREHDIIETMLRKDDFSAQDLEQLLPAGD